MSDAGAVWWLVAAGEPGAERFGQFVQRLRKSKQMSVEQLAASADLSVGTIRAVEQARRAPSEESGRRLLQALLPEGSLSTEPEALPGSQDFRPDVVFVDPESGSQIMLEFKAKTAGDNRRWSSDKPTPGESLVEARLREMAQDPEAWAEWQRGFRAALSQMPDYRPIFAELQARAARPADDAAYGRLVRRLATRNEFDLESIEDLLDIWDRASSEDADERARSHASQVNDILGSYKRLPPEDRPTSWE